MKRTKVDPALLTNPDKVLFPHAHITKKDLGDYYAMIAPLMLPHLKNRLLSMQRFPDGINKEGFFQKNISPHFPEWVDRYSLTNKDGSTTTYAIVQNQATLIYLSYQAVITFHTWLSRVDKLDYPDKMIFDLDPGKKITFPQIKQYALKLKDFLESYGFTSFAMTTGSRGIHIVCPLRRSYTFETVRAYSQQLAIEFAQSAPDELTVEIRKDKRKGRLFIDYIRNTYAHTAVAPYSVRPLPNAPIATPVTWKEVATKKLEAQTYTIANIAKRIQKVGNVWEKYNTVKNTLKKR